MTQNSQEDLRKHMRQFAAIGVALSAEKDIDKILEMIIVEAMDFARADGGTLYLVDPNENVLRFALIHNKTLGTSLGGRSGSIDLPPVQLERDGSPNTTNVSAYAVITQNVVNIPDVYEIEHFDFAGTREYDKKTGYRSKSMLVVPMKDHEDTVIGVLQLINAMAGDGKTAIPFTPDQQEIVESLASQAAVALNNAHLIHNLEDLFNSLITSIGTAIDEKSDHTGGHVRRVAELVIDIARAINESDKGSLTNVYLDENKLKGLQIAGWLHDLGKVTTPESLLDKSKKLEKITDRAEIVSLRYDIAKLQVRLEAAREMLRDGTRRLEVKTETMIAKKLQELDDEKEFVLKWNDPMVAPDKKDVLRLQKIACENETLNDDELMNLCLERGTLSPQERKIVENHVVVTNKMLSQIIFPKLLEDVPSYAGSHHEMLDGSGYPNGLKGDDIPIQARILAIADIFEALTADRPYKDPIPLDESIAILEEMAEQGKLDPAMIQAAIDHGVFTSYAERELT